MSDLSLFYLLNGTAFQSETVDALILFSAIFLGYWVVTGVLFFCGISFFPRFSAFRQRNIRVCFESLAAGLAARFIVTELIRFFYSRPRPFEVLADVNILLYREGGGSFPSGHATFFFALAAGIAFHYPRVGVLFFAVALVISFARVAAGVHWPSDILGGAMIGIATGFLVHAIIKRFLR